MKIKTLSKRKKDYRLFCKLFYTASPSEVGRGLYKAGCNINEHASPCKWCRKCKYGVNLLTSIDEAHKIKSVTIPANSYSKKIIDHDKIKKLIKEGVTQGIIAAQTPKALYICDRKQCENCSFPVCRHTTDIKHAANFDKDSSGDYIEKDGIK